jgi:hypothetical protein
MGRRGRGGYFSARSGLVGLLAVQALALAQATVAEEQANPWAFNAPRAEGYRIDLVSAEPPPGTPLLRGASVPFKVTVSYSLDVAPHGAVILVFQDESNKVVTGERGQTTVEVQKGNGVVTLADTVVVPSDANELRLFIPIVPDGLTTTTGEITLRYPITGSFSGPQYMPYPLADITAAQWGDYHRLVAETFTSSRREFPDEHLEIFHNPDSTMHLAFTTAGHPAHPAWITRKVLEGSVDQIGYFAGPEEPFAELFRSYLDLTKKTLAEIPDEADGP